jgi:hypothetical protein
MQMVRHHEQALAQATCHAAASGDPASGNRLFRNELKLKKVGKNGRLPRISGRFQRDNRCAWVTRLSRFVDIFRKRERPV